MLEYFRQALDTGRPEAVGAVEEVLWPMFYRRWLDPAPFAESLRAHGQPPGHVWQAEIALSKMTELERDEVYAEVLRTGRVNEDLGLGWGNAAYRVLLEHMGALVPDIEATMDRSPQANYEKAETRVPRRDLLELAHARPGDWEANYLRLIRDKLEIQATAAQPDADSVVNGVIREALLELVHSGNRKLLSPLKAMWRSIKNRSMKTPENQRILGQLVKQGLRDPDYSRPGLAATYLVRAIQALGDPGFQEKNTHRKELLQDTKRRLAEAGWLRPVPEAQ